MLHSDLSIIARGSETFMSRCLGDFGITAAEVILLIYLYGHDNSRQEDLAEYFMLDKGTIAKTLQKLEKKEIIERIVNKEDQREKVSCLTDKGYALQDVCTDLVRLWHETMFQGITAEEGKIFERTVHKIAANVTENLEKWEHVYGRANAS
ncbi:MarR family transcriptional regulator [Oscillospiraceae bacterium WX1]